MNIFESSLADALPAPHAPEAEMSVLGSMILAGGADDTIDAVKEILRSSTAFHTERHQRIYVAVCDVYERSGTIDLVQLKEALGGQLESVGGVEYLLELANSVPSSVNAPHYARIVINAHYRRRLAEVCAEAIHRIKHERLDTAEDLVRLIDETETSIFKLASGLDSRESKSAEQVLAELISNIRNPKTEPEGLKTGIRELDTMTCGLQRGDMIIIGARPSMGKTALGLTLMSNMSRRGHRCLLLSLEMSTLAIQTRLISIVSGVNGHNLRSQNLPPEERQLAISAGESMLDWDNVICDKTSLTVGEARAIARRAHRTRPLDVVIIDYLQLMTAPQSNRESRQVEVSTISRGVKALARELDVPVVCLSQLNRATEARGSHKPRLSDLRESGAIEQDADVVALLHREDYYHIDDPTWAYENPSEVGMGELIVAKQRNGPTGVVRVRWDNEAGRFQNPGDRRGVGYSKGDDVSF